MHAKFLFILERRKERIFFSKVIIKHQNRHSIKIINSERIDKRHIGRPLIVYPIYINNSGYLNKIMIKIKYIFDFLIFSLKRRYFGYEKTFGGSPSIEALSPLLEDICNCGERKQRFACFNFGLVTILLPDVALAVRTSQILTISEPKATRRHYRSILQIIWSIYCEMCNNFARIKHCCQIQWP